MNLRLRTETGSREFKIFPPQQISVNHKKGNHIGARHQKQNKSKQIPGNAQNQKTAGNQKRAAKRHGLAGFFSAIVFLFDNFGNVIHKKLPIRAVIGAIRKARATASSKLEKSGTKKPCQPARSGTAGGEITDPCQA